MPGGVSCWLSVSLEGGWGHLYSTPRPWQPTQGRLPQQRQGQLPAPGGVCLEVGLCHAGRRRTLRGKKKRRHLLTTFYTGSQGFENSFFFNNCVGSNAYERFLGRITTVVCLQVEEVQRLGGREMGWLRLSVSHPHLLAFNKSLRSISCTARTDEMTEL